MEEQAQSKVKVPHRLKTTTCWLYSHLDAENATVAAAQGVTLTASESAAGSAGATQEASLAQLQEDYDVLGIVGESPVCRVYKVRNKRMGIVMALKVLKDEFATSTAAEKQFQREVNAATTLCHPNIVPIYGHGRLDNNAAFVVEKLCDDAKNLAQVIKQEGTLEPERALNLFRQIADAMEHAHTKAVAHGDLKPSNIVITGSPAGQTPTDQLNDGQKGEINSHSNQLQPKHAWVRLARLLACVLLFYTVVTLVSSHQVSGKPWDAAFNDYEDSADKADGAKTIQIAEHMLSIADDRHMPVTMALAAEAYWRDGNDAKAHELLARDIDLCRKNKRYLSAISACEIQFGEQLRSGDLAAAHASAQQALSLVNACTDLSNWRETPVRVDEDSWTPLLSNRWLHPLLRNLGAEDPNSDNVEPTVDSFDFKWTCAPPERPVADFCQTFLRYGDAKDAQYFADQMLQHEGDLRMTSGDRSMYAMYSAIASYRLGELNKGDQMTKLAQQQGIPALKNEYGGQLDWALAQLAAQCLVRNDTVSARHLLASTPGTLIWNDSSVAGKTTRSALVNKALNASDNFDECAEFATAMGQQGQVTQISTMYQSLLSGLSDSGVDDLAWASKWVSLDTDYIEDLTMLRRTAEAHQARQQALDRIGGMIGHHWEDSSVKSDISDALSRIFNSALVQKDLKQAQRAVTLMGKINASKDDDNYDQWRLMSAELPGYSGNFNQSIKQLTALLAERSAGNSDEPIDSNQPGTEAQTDIEVEIHAALGKLNLLSDQPSPAIAQYQKAIQASIGDNEDADSQAYLRVDLARAYWQAGNAARAKEQIEKILQFRRRLSYRADGYFVSTAAKQFPELLKNAPRNIYPGSSGFDAAVPLPDWHAFRLL
ncbi:MAG TPA: protein kinase [Trichormus sp.]|jgi:tetratricopeptide (TPR) repeat protein